MTTYRIRRRHAVWVEDVLDLELPDDVDIADLDLDGCWDGLDSALRRSVASAPLLDYDDEVVWIVESDDGRIVSTSEVVADVDGSEAQLGYERLESA